MSAGISAGVDAFITMIPVDCIFSLYLFTLLHL